MCLRLNAASIAVPLGDRSGWPAFSQAGLDEGLQRLTFPSPVSIDSSTKLEPVCLVGEKFR